MIQERTALDNREDEMDLIVLAEKTFSFFSRYGRLIAAASIAGMLLGLLLFFVLPKRYSSTLLLHSFTLTNTEHINIIENWNELLKKGEYEALGRDLNCDPNMLKKVYSITASEIQKLYIQNNPNGFEVEAVVGDTAVLAPLQQGIVTGLENGDYIKAKLESRRSNLNQLIDKINIEITKLDSTKKEIENSLSNNNRSSSSYILDVSGITGQIISLQEKLLGARDELKFTHAVQVFHNFAKFNRPESPKLLKLLVLGLIGGFTIGYVAAVYRSIKRRLAYRSGNLNVVK